MHEQGANRTERGIRRSPTGGRASRWLLSAAAGATITAGVGLGLTAPVATAADACSNHAQREQQGSTRLPDCRAYEQVSPVDKNGGTIAAGLGVRPEGGGATFWSTGAFAGSLSSITANYSAVRTDEGWQTTALNPPSAGRNPLLMDQLYLAAISPDYTRAIITTGYPIDPDDQTPGFLPGMGQTDVYRREADGWFDWLSQPPLLPDEHPLESNFAAASDDLEQVAIMTSKPLTADVPEDSTDQQVYVRDGDVTRLISVGPDGEPLAGGATLGDNDWAAGSALVTGGSYASALSADGTTAYFKSDRYVTDQQIYVRTDALDPDEATTKHVSRSHVAGSMGAPCTPQSNFLVANDDGSRMWFGCRSQLTDDAPETGGIYVYDRDDDALEYIAPAPGATGEIASRIAFLAADRDVDYLWFTSAAALAPGAVEGEDNVYVLHDGRFSFVASHEFTPLQVQNATVSVDGSRLVFETPVQIDPRAGGFSQVYAADANAADTTAVCISCRPDGSDSQAQANLHNADLVAFVGPNAVIPRGAAGADGRYFFTSLDRLVPEDTNDNADVYQYRDGELTLISTGTDPGGAVFAGASDDSTDVFLLTAERLVPQDTDNGVADMYTARIDGGFLAPPPNPSCGDDCQGPDPEPFVPPGNVSSVPGGTGNVTPAPAPAAKPKPGVAAAKVSAKQRAAWAKQGRVTLAVKATGAGTVKATVDGRLGKRNARVASASRKLTTSGTAKLTLRLTKSARNHLQRHRKLQITITVRHSGASAPKRTKLTLRAPATKRTNGGAR